MIASLRNVVSAALFLIAVAIMYHKTVVPWLTPIEVTPVTLKPDMVVRPIDNLSDLFAEDAWQRGTPTRLQTPDAMLLFENWKPIDDDASGQSSGWKLWPVTMVIGRGMSNEESANPIVLESVEGAEIRFDGSLDMMAGGAPPIKRGHLIGDVVVRRSGQERPIRLRTRDVIIDRKKIYTTQAVELQMGDLRMVGRDLTLHLTSTSTMGKGSQQTPEPDQLEMIYLDELTMPLEATEDPASGGVISVESGGRVVYDFALDTLQMGDTVSLRRTTSGGLVDEFRCDQLQLTLNRPNDRTIRRETTVDWIQVVSATGNPVQATLPSWDVSVKAGKLDWDATRGQMDATGNRGVEIERGSLTARLASLRYQYDPRKPKQTGSVLVDGVGWVQVSGGELPLRSARWNRRLEIRPMLGTVSPRSPTLNGEADLRTPMEVFVEGGLQATTVDGGSISANRLAGVLIPDPHDRMAWLPDRFDVRDNIQLDTAQIAVAADQLRLYFADGPAPSKNRAHGDDQPTSLGQLVRQPTSGEAPMAPVARQRPEIRGRTINAQVLRSAEGLSASKLSVVDDVEVTHTLMAGGVAMPAKLTGRQLQFVNEGGSDVLQLLSDPTRPAKLELGDGFFVGPEIQVRPAENLIWINDAGQFRIPSAVLAGAGGGQSSSLSAIKWTQPPHCRWRGEMLFDGASAKLTGGVDIDAEFEQESDLWELALRGEMLQVDLSQAVQLHSVDSIRSATVANMTLSGSAQRPVSAEAIGRDEQRSMMSRNLFHAETLQLRPDQDGASLLVGQGPGWYRGWMLGNDQESSLVTDRTMVDSAASELTAVHLIYQGSMTANLTDRDLRFETGVRVAMQPVDTWDAVLDAASIADPAVGVSVLDCDRIRMSADASAIASIGQSPQAWEMQADGGVRFQVRGENRLLKGSTATAFYSTRKDLFTTRGIPGRPATVEVYRADGTPDVTSVIEVLAVHPKTMQIIKLVPKQINMSATVPTQSR